MLLFQAQEFPELRITGLHLFGRGPAVVGQVVAPAVADAALDQTAEIHLGLRDLDQAIAYFSKALAERSPSVVYFKISPDIFMAELNDDPRFQALIEEIGFP